MTIPLTKRKVAPSRRLPPADEILDVMTRELARSMKGLSVPGSPRPYEMLYALRRVETLSLSAAYGGLWRDRLSTRSGLYCDIRVGNHQFDNVVDGGLDDRADERESADWVDAPDDLDPKALQVALWKLTQLKFDEALEDYWDHRKAMVSEHLRHEVGALTRERPVVHIEPLSHDHPFPRESWSRILVELSRRLLDHPEVYDPDLTLVATRIQRWLVTSAGTRVLTEDVYVRVGVEGWVLSDDGVYVEGSRDRYYRSIASVPGRDGIAALVDAVLGDLRELQSAESPGAVIGPALLSGQAASTLFHEALGHRLEGERLVARGETKTFARKRDERILPPGLDIYDDPTVESINGQDLWGSYRVDDQGVRAQRATLVEDGVLRGFLGSRTPLPGASLSNGHARHDGLERPMARMGNLIVRGREVAGVPWATLKQRLIGLAQEQGRRHAVIIRSIRSGETSTADYDFQVFKGELADVSLVDVDTGAELRIRDVELIGTPLAALQRIVAFGREYGVDQGYCYAESGSVPVSGIAPPILLSELELQQRSTTSYHEPLLPPPFADDGSRGRRAKLRERGRRRRRGSD